MSDVFSTLYAIDVSQNLEKKSDNSDLLYLKWSHAWATVKEKYPEANYKIHRFGEAQLPYVFDPETGYMVFVDVTIENITHSMWLAVMDGANKAMKAEPYTYIVGKGEKQREKTVEAATMIDINKTIMRCLVKCLGMHGLGLSLYYGESMSPEVKKRLEEEAEKEVKRLEELTAANAKIIELGKTFPENDRETVFDVIRKYTADGKKNPNGIRTIEDSKACFEELKKLKTEKENIKEGAN